jgi:hypothetical protein
VLQRPVSGWHTVVSPPSFIQPFIFARMFMKLRAFPRPLAILRLARDGKYA